MSRYSRNISVIGAEGQKALADGRVFVVGCGALGGQVAMLLAGAGIGHIGIIDFDTIDISNLQRQLFFTEKECGLPKADVLGNRMHAINSEVEVIVNMGMLTKRNATAILSGYDIVIDATDNPASKLMIQSVCDNLSIPCVIGGVAGWRGQVTTVLPGDSGLEGVFGEISEDVGMTPCAIEGVMGSAAATIASVQAAEAIKYLSKSGELLTKKLFYIDLANNISQIIALSNE